MNNVMQRWVIPTTGLGWRSPCLHDNAAFMAPVNNILAIQPWMKLNLINTKNTTLALAELCICVCDVLFKLVKMLP